MLTTTETQARDYIEAYLVGQGQEHLIPALEKSSPELVHDLCRFVHLETEADKVVRVLQNVLRPADIIPHYSGSANPVLPCPDDIDLDAAIFNDLAIAEADGRLKPFFNYDQIAQI